MYSWGQAAEKGVWFEMKKSETWIKAAALGVLGLVVLIVCIPAATGSLAIRAAHTIILALAILGIIVVTLSDRIMSLTISKSKLKAQLAELKGEVKEMIDVVRSDAEQRPSVSGLGPAEAHAREEEHAKLVEQLSYAESLIEKKPNQESIPELVKDAQNIGKAMGIVQEAIQGRHKNG